MVKDSLDSVVHGTSTHPDSRVLQLRMSRLWNSRLFALRFTGRSPHSNHSTRDERIKTITSQLSHVRRVRFTFTKNKRKIRTIKAPDPFCHRYSPLRPMPRIPSTESRTWRTSWVRTQQSQLPIVWYGRCLCFSALTRGRSIWFWDGMRLVVPAMS